MGLAVAAVALTTLSVARAPDAEAATTGVPHIWPTPQTVQDRHDIVPVTPHAALVTGPYTDPSAVDVVKEVLAQAGVRTVQVVGDTAPRPDVGLTVYIGGPDENTASDEALHAIGIENDASGLPAEGYVLGIGKDADGQGEPRLHARLRLVAKDVPRLVSEDRIGSKADAWDEPSLVLAKPSLCVGLRLGIQAVPVVARGVASWGGEPPWN